MQCTTHLENMLAASVHSVFSLDCTPCSLLLPILPLGNITSSVFHINGSSQGVCVTPLPLQAAPSSVSVTLRWCSVLEMRMFMCMFMCMCICMWSVLLKSTCALMIAGNGCCSAPNGNGSEMFVLKVLCVHQPDAMMPACRLWLPCVIMQQWTIQRHRQTHG